MPRAPLARVVALFASCLTLIAATSAAARPPTYTEQILLEAVNNVRAAHSLRPLRFAWPLQARSHRYAYRLITTDTFAHARLPTGVRENLALGSATLMRARRIVRLWLESPVHRASLLWPAARRAGIGVARGIFQGYPSVRVAVARLRR